MSESRAVSEGEDQVSDKPMVDGEPREDWRALAELRQPFAPEQIGIMKRKNQATGAEVSLSYVGHADVTERLLDVDPYWTWEPFATDEDGAPLVDRNEKQQPVGLWIRLTVAGMTRIGYGSVQAGKADAIKELIGDAIRNAAMRFGVALELWRKQDAHKISNESARASRPAKRKSRTKGNEPPGTPPQQMGLSAVHRAKLRFLEGKREIDASVTDALAKQRYGKVVDDLARADADDLIVFLENASDDLLDASVAEAMAGSPEAVNE